MNVVRSWYVRSNDWHVLHVPRCLMSAPKSMPLKPGCTAPTRWSEHSTCSKDWILVDKKDEICLPICLHLNLIFSELPLSWLIQKLPSCLLLPPMRLWLLLLSPLLWNLRVGIADTWGWRFNLLLCFPWRVRDTETWDWGWDLSLLCSLCWKTRVWGTRDTTKTRKTVRRKEEVEG